VAPLSCQLLLLFKVFHFQVSIPIIFNSRPNPNLPCNRDDYTYYT
jgi:hypothetical protein